MPTAVRYEGQYDGCLGIHGIGYLKGMPEIHGQAIDNGNITLNASPDGVYPHLLILKIRDNQK